MEAGSLPTSIIWVSEDFFFFMQKMSFINSVILCNMVYGVGKYISFSTKSPSDGHIYQ